MAREFARYIGIDYSGAEVPESSLQGLRVYVCEGDGEPREVLPEAGPRRYLSRRGIAEWLERELKSGPRTMVGIDHGFSFPLAYFEKYSLPLDWTEFLRDFQRHWPTDEEHVYVDFIRDGVHGRGAERVGSSRWRRECEIRAAAKSVFHFDVPGSVAKSTFAGLPWLLYLRNWVRQGLHFWPFDGWEAAADCSVVAEAYPKLYGGRYAVEGRNGHQQDAYSIAAWLRDTDGDGSLREYLRPELSGEALQAARVEGWILGVR